MSSVPILPTPRTLACAFCTPLPPNPRTLACALCTHSTCPQGPGLCLLHPLPPPKTLSCAFCTHPPQPQDPGLSVPSAPTHPILHQCHGLARRGAGRGSPAGFTGHPSACCCAWHAGTRGGESLVLGPLQEEGESHQREPARARRAGSPDPSLKMKPRSPARGGPRPAGPASPQPPGERASQQRREKRARADCSRPRPTSRVLQPARRTSPAGCHSN